MDDVQLWIARLEGRLAASEYLMRITLARLLANNIEDRDLVLGELRKMVVQVEEVAVENHLAPAFVEAYRKPLQQILNDFETNGGGVPPTFTVIPGGKAGEPDPV